MSRIETHSTESGSKTKYKVLSLEPDFDEGNFSVVIQEWRKVGTKKAELTTLYNGKIDRLATFPRKEIK